MKLPLLIVLALLSPVCRSLAILHSSPEQTALCAASGILTMTDQCAKTLPVHSDNTNPVVMPQSGDTRVIVNPEACNP